MRNAEGLVQVEVGHVGTVIARTTKPNLGVHVGAIEKDLVVRNHKFDFCPSTSVTRLGDFESSCWQIVFQKCPKYLVTFWDFWKVTFKVKTSVVILWQLLEENWLLKNLTSGHTAPDWWVHRWLQNFMICDLRLLPVLRADGWVSRYQRWFARRLRWSTDRWSSHKRACQNTFPPRWIKI